MNTFVYSAHPSRVVFGAGATARLCDEVRRLGCSRAVVLASEPLAEVADRVCRALGPVAVGRFDGAVVYTPAEVTDEAWRVVHACSADCLVAVGGGSTTGLSKALAVRTCLPQLILPTTYAGSEVTPVSGEVVRGRKTKRSCPEALPETVIYDAELTLGLPVGVSVASAVNALAHAVEALYSPDANPIIDGFALEVITRIARSLPALGADPSDMDGRVDVLHAAWLAGICLGSVAMGLHHQVCHTLGGQFQLPHAPMHAVVLPHALAYNAPAVPEVMRRIGEVLGVADAVSGLHELVGSLPVPRSLCELGMSEKTLSDAIEAPALRDCVNPRPITESGLAELLRNAWQGSCPRREVALMT